jgi:aspartyl-tRNA(Asn)/glutamyl-tRNA(Gln) amidotransferase subunit C
MSITIDQVRKVALLARLELTEADLAAMAVELGEIVDYVDQLAALSLDDVLPMDHPLELSNVFAEDRVEPSLPRPEALRSAAEHNGVCFLVPAVLGD